jgi:hypothetical protein
MDHKKYDPITFMFRSTQCLCREAFLIYSPCIANHFCFFRGRVDKQGCPMAYFQSKIFNLGKFWSVLQRKMLVYLIINGSYLRPFGIFWGHLVYFMVFGMYFPVLVCCTKKNLATLLTSTFYGHSFAPQQHKEDWPCELWPFLPSRCHAVQALRPFFDRFQAQACAGLRLRVPWYLGANVIN